MSRYRQHQVLLNVQAQQNSASEMGWKGDSNGA